MSEQPFNPLPDASSGNQFDQDDQFDMAEQNGLTPFDPDQFTEFHRYDAEASAWQEARDRLATDLVAKYRTASERAVAQKTSDKPPAEIDESLSWEEVIKQAFAGYMRGERPPFSVILNEMEGDVYEQVVVRDGDIHDQFPDFELSEEQEISLSSLVSEICNGYYGLDKLSPVLEKLPAVVRLTVDAWCLADAQTGLDLYYDGTYDIDEITGRLQNAPLGAASDATGMAMNIILDANRWEIAKKLDTEGRTGDGAGLLQTASVPSVQQALLRELYSGHRE